MPRRPERGSGCRQDHWRHHAGNWANLGPPLRPSPEDVRIVEQAIPAQGAAPLRALLLGVTPEIAGCRWPPGTCLLSVDRSRPMIEMLWPAPGAPADAWAICAEWRAMPLGSGAVDVAVGDGCYNVFDFPASADAFGAEIERVLSPGGIFIVRVFLRPDRKETLEDIARDLEGDAVGSLHALKWRIAGAIHGSTEEGVALSDIWEAWQRLRPLARKQGARWGWRPGEFATLEAYRGASARYCFPTIGNFRALVSRRFEERASATGSYELAERCVTFILAKPAP